LGYQERRDGEKAEILHRKALELTPEWQSIINNLVAVLLKLKKCAEAEMLCKMTKRCGSMPSQPKRGQTGAPAFDD